MKLRWSLLISFAVILAVLVLLSMTTPAQATRPAVVPVVLSDDPLPLNNPPPLMEYLLGLPLPNLADLHIPADLSPAEATEYAYSLAQQQAQPLQTQLEAWQAAGRIAGYQVRPDRHGIVVQVPAGSAIVAELAQLPGVRYVAPLAESITACSTGAAAALAQQIAVASRRGSMSGFGLTSLGGPLPPPGGTNPSIHIYASPGSSSYTYAGHAFNADAPTSLLAVPTVQVYDYAYILGWTVPNTPVTLRIWRGGKLIVTDTSVSQANGFYSFSPSYRYCPEYGYSWQLRAGDRVEVIAGNHAASTIVAWITAGVDPVTNVVAGVTEANRTVRVDLEQPGICSSTIHSQTVPADTIGAFRADFTHQVDFDRRASATIYALDSNGNSTIVNFDAYHLVAQLNYASFDGSLPPETNFVATLRRAGSVVDTYSGQSGADGYYWGNFSQALRPGDVIQVTTVGASRAAGSAGPLALSSPVIPASNGIITIELVATTLTVTLNASTDRVTGTTGIGRLVIANFSKRNISTDYARTSCPWVTACAGVTTSITSSFVLTAGFDVVPGDYVQMTLFDAEGNEQKGGRFTAPAIIADLTNNRIKGYWGVPGEGITITLKNSSGVNKQVWNNVSTSSWDGNTSAWPSSGVISPTDVIVFSRGPISYSMTVQNLTARLSGLTGHLTGRAANGPLLAVLRDKQCGTSTTRDYCRSIMVTDGSYDLAFDEAQVGAGDTALVWSTGPDGHYTYREARAFEVNAQVDGRQIKGYVETPRAVVTITLRDGAVADWLGSLAIKGVYTATASDHGYYDYIIPVTDNITITQGDELLIETSDSTALALHAPVFSLRIPLLTANLDAAANQLYGRAPAGQSVFPQLKRYTRYGDSNVSSLGETVADATGHYTASLNNLLWERDCSAVQAGHSCVQAVVYYYTPACQQLWAETPRPGGPPADTYEADNARTAARPYTGIQHHTFHTITDTDWISFTVPVTDVTRKIPYQIETFNLGWSLGMRVRLYAPNGTTLLADYDAYESPSQPGWGVSFSWTPTAAGTYYLWITQTFPGSQPYCDAVYDLRILPRRYRIYAPLILRDYP